jgi:FkbM family methyltransferase
MAFYSPRTSDPFVDCGANAGQFAMKCRQAGYKGRILSLEPLTAPFARLSSAAARDPLWSIAQLAVGEENGTLELNLTPGQEELGSALDANPAMVDRFRGLSFVRHERARLCRLDGLLAERAEPLEARLFVKSDTQGYDLRVLRGLGARFEQVDGLLLEMSIRPLYTGMPSHWEMLEFVRRAEFEPFGFASGTRDTQGGMIEYDALFRRRQPGDHGTEGR